MSTSTTPDIDEVTADVSDLRQHVHAIIESFENRWQDGASWPIMLGEIHCAATDLAQRTQQLAEQLAALAGAYPHGQLPEDANHVPVIGHSQQHLDQLCAGADPQEMQALILERHYPQLAGPGPHTVVLTDATVGGSMAEFRDGAGRTVLIVFYGAQPDQAREYLDGRAITALPLPFVPRVEGTFFSLMSIAGGGRLYDRFGKLSGDDTRP